MITVIAPAHNEERSIAETIEALRKQSVPVDKIIVVNDNSTDRTADIATEMGAEVFTTVENTDKKAGALNQALNHYLPEMDDTDYVIIQDADTELGRGYVRSALRKFEGRDDIGAVGGSFFIRGEDNFWHVVVGNEYRRYVREIARRRDQRANVLTGAGSMFRVGVLREVAHARTDGVLPGDGGRVYKQDALTEDNELSLAIKTLGYRISSPKRCAIYTDSPGHWSGPGGLKDQRVRWRRGAMEDLRAYGLTSVTWPYIGKMLWSLFVTLLSIAYVGLVVGVIVIGGVLVPNWFWLSVFFIYILDRWWTVRDRPLKAQVYALFFPFEMIYDILQQYVLLKAFADFLRHKEKEWTH